MKGNGFLQLRRGVWEHLRNGRMSHMDALAFIYIVSQADTRTGVWNGSASSLAGEIVISPRNARRLLERLTAAGYLKRFPVPGKHVCYPILVHKYPISDGQHKGQHLDALSSNSATDLRYAATKSGEQECEHKGEQKASQKILETRDKRQKPAAKPAPPADPRFQSFLDFAFKAFQQKHGQKPTWTGKDFKALSVMLASNRSIDAAELERRFRSYLASTEAFTAKHGDSLAYFCAHTDSFLAGPIFERSHPNGSHGVKASNVETTLDGFRQLQTRAN